MEQTEAERRTSVADDGENAPPTGRTEPTGPGRDEAPGRQPITADAIRAARFHVQLFGYSAREVDRLLDRLAAAIDAGEAFQPLLESVELGSNSRGYRRRDVDRFMDGLRGHSSTAGPDDHPAQAHGGADSLNEEPPDSEALLAMLEATAAKLAREVRQARTSAAAVIEAAREETNAPASFCVDEAGERTITER